MKKTQFILTILMLFIGTSAMSQVELTQTLRGTLIDFDTKVPIIGARLILPGTDPLLGGITDENGDFKITNVPVGRISLKITAIGYQPISMPSVLIESGKEKILNFDLTPDITILTKVEVTSQKDKSEAINKMATVSAKSFSVEETNRYAGSFNDPARMASGFAGVTGDAEGDNDIVVRGNSPRGILWRLDGIDIPNPNHFSDNGATGGPINALNGAVLSNSDFFSGAFAPEYGNALSGVFDVKMRQGNNQKREYTFQAGALGLEATLEGPFKKGYRGSYMVNYRYSTLSLMDKAGILDFGGVPIYQDAAFKFNFPTKKAGTFTIVGLGGISKIIQTSQNDSTGEIYGVYDFKANLGMAALKHTFIVNPKVYLKSYVSASTQYNGGEGQFLKKDSVFYTSERESFTDNNIKVQSIANFKANQKNIFQIGATYTHFNYHFFEEDDYDDQDGVLTRFQDSKGNTEMMQSFLSWRHRITNNLTIVSGVHHTTYLLNNNTAVEPRAGMKWQVTPRHSVSAGFGMHSRLESPSVYLYNELQEDGTYSFPNKELDLTKSRHYVLGYGYRLSENMHFKTEVYYQQLYNVPIAKDPTSDFSFLNWSAGVPDFELINEGKGRNYGAEFTLERFFQNNYYFLVTGSVYQSKYTLKDGVERSTRYDANYAANLLAGKEFKFGKKKGNNKTFGINTKVSLIGGNRFTPIDLPASQDAGYSIPDWSNPWGAKGDDIFFINLGLTYRCDMKRASHSFKIDVQNLTNNKAVVSEFYNGRTNKIDTDVQLSIIPNVIYTIKF
ncbi:MAG: TonB-dependent receptor plug domain-containing protein [Crocinitomix sp.]|nr:TonB-dependent receptor plug domain-containing protein [Crocinitomix sp.]